MNDDCGEYNTDDFDPGYTNPSFYPLKSRVPALDIFQSRIEKDLVSLKSKRIEMGKRKSYYNNLSSKHRQALNTLKNNHLKKRTRGGSEVVPDAGLYKRQALDILFIDNTYKRLTSDPSLVIKKNWINYYPKVWP